MSAQQHMGRLMSLGDEPGSAALVRILAVLFALCGGLLIVIDQWPLAYTMLAGSVGVVLLARNPPLFAAIVGVSYLSVHLLASEQVIGLMGNRNIKVSELLGLLLTVMLFVRALPHILGSGFALIRPFFGPLVLFVASVVTSFALSPHHDLALGTAFHVLGVLAVFVFAIVTASHPGALETYWAAVQVAGVATAISALQSVGADRLTSALSVGARRSAGLFGRANVTADVILVAFPSFFARFISPLATRTGRFIGLSGMVLCGLGLFATFTRASILGALIFLGLHLASRRRLSSGRRERSRKVVAVVIAVAAVAIGIAAVDEQTLQSRLADVPGLGGVTVSDSSSGSGRIGIWKAMIRGLAQNGPLEWLIGNGMQASLNATARDLGSQWAAHNSALELLYGHGLVGLIAYIWLIVTIWRELMRSAEMEGNLGLLSVTQANLLLAFTLSVEMFTSAVYGFVSRWYMFLLIGAVIGTAQLRRAEAAIDQGESGATEEPHGEPAADERGREVSTGPVSE